MSAAGAALAQAQVHAAEPGRSFRSGTARVAVLELFTSEGCSSCPPAETWFSGLRDDPGLWSKFVPMAFHVDYWDYLGWKDRLASAANTRRQHQYAGLWRSSQVYTPCFVLNGQEWRGRRLELPGVVPAGVLSLDQVARGKWRLNFAPASEGGGDLLYHVALLGSASSKVSAGENAGHTLHHDFVVLAHTSFVSAAGPVTLQCGADGSENAVAAWVSRGDDPTPLQAVGGRL